MPGGSNKTTLSADLMLKPKIGQQDLQNLKKVGQQLNQGLNVRQNLTGLKDVAKVLKDIVKLTGELKKAGGAAASLAGQIGNYGSGATSGAKGGGGVTGASRQILVGREGAFHRGGRLGAYGAIGSISAVAAGAQSRFGRRLPHVVGPTMASMDRGGLAVARGRESIEARTSALAELAAVERTTKATQMGSAFAARARVHQQPGGGPPGGRWPARAKPPTTAQEISAFDTSRELASFARAQVAGTRAQGMAGAYYARAVPPAMMGAHYGAGAAGPAGAAALGTFGGGFGRGGGGPPRVPVRVGGAHAAAYAKGLPGAMGMLGTVGAGIAALRYGPGAIAGLGRDMYYGQAFANRVGLGSGMLGTAAGSVLGVAAGPQLQQLGQLNIDTARGALPFLGAQQSGFGPATRPGARMHSGLLAGVSQVGAGFGFAPAQSAQIAGTAARAQGGYFGPGMHGTALAAVAGARLGIKPGAMGMLGFGARRGGFTGRYSGKSTMGVANQLYGAGMGAGLGGMEIPGLFDQAARQMGFFQQTGVAQNIGFGAGDVRALGTNAFQSQRIVGQARSSAQQRAFSGRVGGAADVFELQSLGGLGSTRGGVSFGQLNRAQEKMMSGNFGGAEIADLVRRFSRAAGGGESGVFGARVYMAQRGMMLSNDVIRGIQGGGSLPPDIASELAAGATAEGTFAGGGGLSGRAARATTPELRGLAGSQAGRVQAGVNNLPGLLAVEAAATRFAVASSNFTAEVTRMADAAKLGADALGAVSR